MLWHSTRIGMNPLVCTYDLNLDDVSKQLVALKILAESLEKGVKSLCYLYEEYSVSYFIYFWQFISALNHCIGNRNG